MSIKKRSKIWKTIKKIIWGQNKKYPAIIKFVFYLNDLIRTENESFLQWPKALIWKISFGKNFIIMCNFDYK